MALPRSIVAPLFLAAGFAASTAHAQVHQIAWTTADTDTEGDRATDAGVGVHPDGVMVTTNMHVALFARAGGSALDEYQVGDTGFPFVRTDATYGRLFDPQVDYDPIRGRLWMLYTEDNDRDPSTTTGGDIARIHLALTKNPAVFPVGSSAITSLSSGHWWYFTGSDAASTSRDGEAFDLGSSSLLPYQNQGEHSPLIILADRPTMAFDEQAVILTPWSANQDAEISTSLIVIPTSHGTSDSILDGDRPDEGDITIISLSGEGLDDEDFSLYYMAVQEPHDQFPNKTFYINDPNGAGTPEIRTGIRLCGLYWDEELEPDPDWHVRQKTAGGSLDIPFDDDDDRYHVTTSPGPRTPHGTWRPSVAPARFNTAVLVYNSENEPRIFAAHDVKPYADDTKIDQYVVQWYVIDPDFTNFKNTNWNPTFDAVGRLDHGATTGDHYHPVIGVTEQGVAYIEYTYSDANTWPQVRRVQLSSDYATALTNTEVVVQAGPSYHYASDTWAHFAEMQADPAGDCAFWSVHTLVGNPGDATAPSDERDIWLFETLFNCGNANLNGDGGTDLYDMALFNSYYSTGARRVDMNTDGTTDATDAILYQDAYDAQKD